MIEELTLKLRTMWASEDNKTKLALLAAYNRAVQPFWYQYHYWIIVNIVSQSTALCVTSHINTQITSYDIIIYDKQDKIK